MPVSFLVHLCICKDELTLYHQRRSPSLEYVLALEFPSLISKDNVMLTFFIQVHFSQSSKATEMILGTCHHQRIMSFSASILDFDLHFTVQ